MANLHIKPAYQTWHRDGQKSSEEYWELGYRHRLHVKPAIQYWYSNGTKMNEMYYIYGFRTNCNLRTELRI
jgi:hypothetical protein